MAESTLRSMLRMLSEPRAAFAATLKRRNGFNGLFLLLLIEFLLEQPELAVTSALRITTAPLSALAAFVRYGAASAFFVFATGVALHYATRGADRKIDMETGAALIAHAWVPHTVWIATSVLIAHLGFDHPLMPHTPVRELIELGPIWQLGGLLTEYAPVVGFSIFAYRLAGSDDSDESGLSKSVYWPVPVLTALLLTLVLSLNVVRVQANWEDVRPTSRGDALPKAQLAGLYGGHLDTESLRGHVVLVDFWATWCGPCRQTMPRLDAIARDFAERPFALLSINVEPQNTSAVRRYVEENGFSFPVHIDTGELSERLHVDTLPTLFLVDADGNIRDIHVGAWGVDSLRGRIESLLEETLSPRAQTR